MQVWKRNQQWKVEAGLDRGFTHPYVRLILMDEGRRVGTAWTTVLTGIIYDKAKRSREELIDYVAGVLRLDRDDLPKRAWYQSMEESRKAQAYAVYCAALHHLPDLIDTIVERVSQADPVGWGICQKASTPKARKQARERACKQARKEIAKQLEDLAPKQQ